jgi:MinD-like ATPase involved in chromosome partitioning or flagellar assembly
MSYVISFVGTKDGQGLTTTALAVADELARKHQVIFLDADQTGTGTAVDALHVDPATRGMNHLVGPSTPITAEALVHEAVPTRNRNLAIVPGLMAVCGKRVADLVEQLVAGEAFAQLPHHFVVVDWGAALAHPLLESPSRAARSLARVSQRVFVVFQDSPPRLARSLQVLIEAEPPKAELILVESRHGSLSRSIRESLELRLPALRVVARIKWDPHRAMAAEDAGEVIPGIGQQVVRAGRIVELAKPFLPNGAGPGD